MKGEARRGEARQGIKRREVELWGVCDEQAAVSTIPVKTGSFIHTEATRQQGKL